MYIYISLRREDICKISLGCFSLTKSEGGLILIKVCSYVLVLVNLTLSSNDYNYYDERGGGIKKISFKSFFQIKINYN